MSLLVPACVACVVAWIALVVVAHLLNPDQDAFSMGMSGLARGRAPWVMRWAFIVRGLAALLLVPALSDIIGTGGFALFGLFSLWVWGAGSAALSGVETDMPGEPPSRAGTAHTIIALVACVAGVLGAFAVSVVLRGDDATAGVARWALPVALAAAVFLALQLIAFRAAARREGGAAAGSPRDPAAPDARATAPPPLTVGTAARARGSWADAFRSAAQDLAGYPGLFQRIFVGLLMLWTLLVALGI